MQRGFFINERCIPYFYRMNNDPRAEAFLRLLTIMDELRAQCPWDREQTLASLRHLTIEETYELSDAILQEDFDEIKKELGDILLHIVFYAKIGSEQKQFDITSVINTLCEKLIRRHPHIYGEVKVDNAEQVKQNWEQIKQGEHKGEKSVLSGVPASLPSTIKAIRIQEKAAQVGFDWEEEKQVWEKVKEELGEFEQETDPIKQEKEFGDLLFALINYARFRKINPDDALEGCNRKFIARFGYIEKKAKETGVPLKEMTLEQMESYWQEAKTIAD